MFHQLSFKDLLIVTAKASLTGIEAVWKMTALSGNLILGTYIIFLSVRNVLSEQEIVFPVTIREWIWRCML